MILQQMGLDLLSVNILIGIFNKLDNLLVYGVNGGRQMCPKGSYINGFTARI
jgi:hypothetical protein